MLPTHNIQRRLKVGIQYIVNYCIPNIYLLLANLVVLSDACAIQSILCLCYVFLITAAYTGYPTENRSFTIKLLYSVTQKRNTLYDLCLYNQLFALFTVFLSV